MGVQPFGSVTFGSDHVTDPQIIIAGIGNSIPFGNVDHTLYDTLHWTGFDAALAGSVDLLRRHAVFAGLSTGAAYLVARWRRRPIPTAGWCSWQPTPDTGTWTRSSPATRRPATSPISTPGRSAASRSCPRPGAG